MWADIPGYEGIYQINRDGHVVSLTKAGRQGRHARKKPVIIRHATNRHGYEVVKLCLNGKERYHAVHRLLLTVFVRPPKDGEQGCHNNGIRNDNRIENLRWGTAAENQADRRIHDTALVGVKNHNARLDPQSVSEIRNKYLLGASKGALSREYKVNHRTITDVINRRTWKEVA